MKFFLFCIFIFFIPSQASRCVDRLEEEVVGRQGKIVNTNLGRLVGKRETDIDPRQNKTVSWTSYYVGHTLVKTSSLVPLFSL